MKPQIQTSVISNFLYIEVFTQVPWTSIYPSFTVYHRVPGGRGGLRQGRRGEGGEEGVSCITRWRGGGRGWRPSAWRGRGGGGGGVRVPIKVPEEDGAKWLRKYGDIKVSGVQICVVAQI